jgi:hypothetical protein
MFELFLHGASFSRWSAVNDLPAKLLASSDCNDSTDGCYLLTTKWKEGSDASNAGFKESSDSCWM